MFLRLLGKLLISRWRFQSANYRELRHRSRILMIAGTSAFVQYSVKRRDRRLLRPSVVL